MVDTTATTNGLYVPVHKRSSSSTSHRSHSARGIYSIPELLNLSLSPLAHLSHEQEHQVRDHLYLASSWKQPAKAKPVLKLPVPSPGSQNEPVVAVQPKQSPRHWKQPTKAKPILKLPIPSEGSQNEPVVVPPKQSVGHRTRSSDVAESERKRKGWGYSVHPRALQSDWRGIRLPVVTLGI